jgi:hypothetical protein
MSDSSQTPDTSAYINVTPINKYMNNVISVKDNVWNTDYENIISNLSNKAKGYRYIYTEAINYYTLLYNWIYGTQALISWSTLVIQTIYTALSGSGITVSSVGFNISIALLIFLSNSLVTVLTKLSLTAKISSCNRIAQSCTTYFTNLDVVLNLPESVRILPYTAVQLAQTDYNNLITNMTTENISIPQHIINKYIAEHKDSNFIIEIVDDMIPKNKSKDQNIV